ncbi:MAG: polysaccharide deacetylase family protein [Janibacter sp.]
MRRAAITLAVTVVIVLALGAGAFTLMNSRTTQVDGEIVSRVETDEKVVALTFDDGPAAEDADALLSTLESRRVPATFYVIGKEASREVAVMRRLVRDGHEIGNHTWSHPRMVFVSTDEIAEEVESTDRAIRDSGLHRTIDLRPPYGKKLITLPRYLAAHDRRTIDATRPGSIILLHPWNGRTTTQKAIGPIIDGLRDEGYRFVTVSELTG